MGRGLIDVHGHIGSFRGYDLSGETLVAEVEEAGVELLLVSNIDGAKVPGKTRGLDEEEANRATEAWVRARPDRFRGLLWGRPGSGSADCLRPFLGRRLEGEGAFPWSRRTFVGIKLHPEMNHFDADAPEVDPYLELAAEGGVPVVIHSDARVDQASASRILALARRHPTVPVVLYHTGFQGPHAPVIQAAAEVLRSGAADVYLETAQLPPEAALEAVEVVGPRRLLFGTDATYYGRGHYRRYAPLLAALEERLDPEALHAVLRENARALFRLAGPESDTTVDREKPPRQRRDDEGKGGVG